ncbi:patched family-domain-containing protein [Lentinula boryana]|uniref:Patched family-domain-containing protein n=1 Tax=Lentinula boryana TaxID=40481 RepID=A0ABQ8QIJ8_9AGAR|nr:patched family-domain-containing protein [Lentinula boryana]
MSDPPQRCGMRDTCGSKTLFGKQLPCPYDGPPKEPSSSTRKLLLDVCGPEFYTGPVCCTFDQLQTLEDNFRIVDKIVSSCPACKNNFHDFFCKFTCSPNQGTFLNVTSTQTTNSNQIAVKSVDFFVGPQFSQGFFESCRDVKFDASNGYAMDFIGGGAKDYQGFFRFLGEEKDLGSPFQINFPSISTTPFSPLNPPPRNCSNNDLDSRCTCIDCPSICPVLPDLPTTESICHVGVLSCLSFTLILTYSLAVVGFIVGFLIQNTIRKRRERRYERLALSGETPSSPRALVGAASLDDHNASLARGLIDPVETVQPKQYRLNSLLRKSFYKLGLTTATYPMLTCAVVFTIIGLINIGWTKFDIETDPVRLWVAPNSETRVQKNFFDEHFRPFYRPQQIFITSVDQENHPVLSFMHLQYVFKLEEHIRQNLVSTPNNLTLDDVCFAPAGPGSPCVVQSVTGWFGGSLDGYDEVTYKDRIERCARSPVECLPDFGQPLAPHYVLGGTRDSKLNTYLDAPALVITAVLSSSVSPPDPEQQQVFERAAEEWERTLRAFLEGVKERSPAEVGLNVDFSTGVSLEEEIGKEGNTDVRIVVGSYIAMFLYVGLTLGGGGSGSGGSSRAARNGSKGWKLHWRAAMSWIRNYTLTSHTLLALFSLVLVLLSISTSVALFSLIGVKVTLVIAEVIPFLVLAVGVDNVFLLMGELERVDAIHGLYAGNNNSLNGHRGRGDERTAAEDHGIADNVDSEARMMSPTRTTRSTRHFPYPARHNHQTSSLSSYSSAPSSAYPNPSYLPPPARIALTLSLIGPSILLSTLAEAVAFLLGALVPMPAVRNFALYAAAGVVINGLLQVCLLAGVGIGLDARRIEAGRMDCIPCISLPGQIALPEDENDRNTLDEQPISPDRSHFHNDHDPARVTGTGSSGWLGRFFKRYYVPFLLKPAVKVVVMIVFGGIFVAGIIGMQGIELGLDQRLALPASSYLVSYFDKMDQYFDVGPPVYFVVRDVDVTQREVQQKLCGRFTTCEKMSLSNILEAERTRDRNEALSTLSSQLQSHPLFIDPDELSLLSTRSSSYLADPAASWIDTFFAWLDPEMDTCCRVRKRNPSIPCRPRDGARLCRPCFEGRDPAWNVTMEGFPEGEEFIQYAKWWLTSEAGEECPLGGREGFSGSVAFGTGSDGDEIVASHFRTFHTPLRSQSEFIASLASARRIAESITESTGVEVFPYSPHYVFFDQYLTITSTTQMILGLGLLSTLLITSIFLGSLRSGGIVTAVTGMVVVCVMGMMRLEGVSLNAISLVNLVMAEGIAVEFCVHVARAFMSAGSGSGYGASAGSVWGFGVADRAKGQKERDERMYIGLTSVGPSVLSGITLTKLIGMCVLGLTRSKLLEIYYFRMWLTLIIAGALHGLVLLPVILSVAGGAALPAQQEADEEWMASAIRSGYEYAPFLADDDSVSSE